MQIKLIIEDEDIVKNVQLITSPIEYLVISAALKQFVENPNNIPADIEVAKRMREVIEDGNDDCN